MNAKPFIALAALLLTFGTHAQTVSNDSYSGPDLGAMIQPVPRTAVMRDDKYFIWCGTMVKEDDTYHLFYSRWEKKYGFQAWVTRSEVAHATSKSPFGPFTFKDVALPVRGAEYWDGLCTHNPTVYKFGSKYYLYYMGNTGDGDDSPSLRGELNWTHRNNQRIGVAVADSPNGPWKRFDEPVIGASEDPDAPDALMASNPAVTQGPDGRYLLVYKAVGKQKPLPSGGPVVHLTAWSDSPTGPFVKDLKPIFTSGEAVFPAEDPFIWSQGGKYYAIVKDQGGYFIKHDTRALVLFESENGMDWSLAPHGYITDVNLRWGDGVVEKLANLERPQLLFEDGKPTVLLAAGRTMDRSETFNVQIPLKRVAGPQVIIPKPVDYTIVQGQLVYSDEGQVKVKVGDRKFIRETKDLPEWSKKGAYRLTIGKNGIEIVSVTETGAFYARQDLAQMRAVSDTLQYCTITDWPRFSYRGLMLDISRNYGDKEWIFKELEAMALLKMNVLHIHLVDGAGWRIQIDSYPELTRKTAWRIGETYEEWTKSGGRYAEEGAPGASGGYLTKEDCREIVARAAELHIEVIPEIEFPGHSNEALVAYPELACVDAAGNKVFNSDMCPSNPATYKFFEAVIDEVIELFPSKMIHIGGDEASRSAWKKCPHCQALMKQEGFTEVAQLQSYMNHRMAEYLNSKGRVLLGWDEITHGGLPEGAAVMSRETEDGKKPMPHGHDIIMTPDTHCYFNYPQDAPFKVPAAFGTYLPLEVAYDYDPMESWVRPEDRHHVLGVQCCLWTEYSPAGEYSEYLLYPRAFATAEIGWSPRERCLDYADFRGRALVLLDTFRGLGYGVFDLAKEYGDRYEATHPVRHLAIGKPVKYAEGHGWDTYWYPSTGETALTDGLFGTWSFKDHRWQRFYCDVDVTIDLEKVTPIHYIGATFLSQRIHSVAFPAKVEMFVSKDGKRFEKCGESTYRMRDEAQVTGDYMEFGAPVNVEARYVRFVAHRDPAPGHAALQLDEIVVN